MNEHEPKGWTPIEDARKAATVLMFAAQTFSAPVEVFLRVKFGRNYFGIPTCLALFAIPMWMLLWPGEDPRPILVFWCLFVLMQARARFESWRMVARGEHVHGRYNGWPRIGRFFPNAPELKLKEYEGYLVIGAGAACLAFSLPLGSFLALAGICLLLCGSVIESAARARALRMQDAFLEQEQFAARFREVQQRDRRN